MDFRVMKTREIIISTFLECVKELGFGKLTVKDITERARINRSTFYKHYEDKYDLRDKYLDHMIAEFVGNMEETFIDKDILNMESYYDELRRCLEGFQKHKQEYLFAWEHDFGERNVFEEMLDGSVEKLRNQILNNPVITPEKKRYTNLYTRLFVNCMMCSVRWWFVEGEFVDSDKFTKLMILHMSEGIFPTLKSPKQI